MSCAKMNKKDNEIAEQNLLTSNSDGSTKRKNSETIDNDEVFLFGALKKSDGFLKNSGLIMMTLPFIPLFVGMKIFIKFWKFVLFELQIPAVNWCYKKNKDLTLKILNNLLRVYQSFYKFLLRKIELFFNFFKKITKKICVFVIDYTVKVYNSNKDRIHRFLSWLQNSSLKILLWIRDRALYHDPGFEKTKIALTKGYEKLINLVEKILLCIGLFKQDFCRILSKTYRKIGHFWDNYIFSIFDKIWNGLIKPVWKMHMKFCVEPSIKILTFLKKYVTASGNFIIEILQKLYEPLINLLILVKKYVTASGNFIIEILKKLYEPLINLLTFVKKYVIASGNFIIEILQKLYEPLIILLTFVKKYVTASGNFIIEILQKLYKTLMLYQEPFQGFVYNLMDLIQNVIQKISDFFGKIYFTGYEIINQMQKTGAGIYLSITSIFKL